MTQVLSTVDEAIAYLSQFANKSDAPDVKLGGELNHLFAKIEGEDYHGTIPGN